MNRPFRGDNRSRRCLAIILFVALASLVSTSTIETTSTSGDVGTPASSASPVASDCTVAPRSLESFRAFVGTPTAARATPALSSATAQMLVAPPADPSAVAGVTATAREWVACGNAGDFLRGFALYTDRLILTSLAQIGITAEGVAFLAATPMPLPRAQQRELVRVWNVRALADGRVGAFVELAKPFSGTTDPEVAVLFFARIAGHYRIDEVVPIGPSTASLAD